MRGNDHSALKRKTLLFFFPFVFSACFAATGSGVRFRAFQNSNKNNTESAAATRKKAAAAAGGALVRSRMQFTVFFSFYQELVHLLQLGWARKFWSRIAELFWVLGVFLTDAILCRMWWFRKSRELSLRSGGCWVVGYVFACTRFIVVFSFSFPFFAKEGELDIYIHWETMPTTSPASFMDVLSEDPQRVFHKDMGCMTGILQIFDRHPALTAQRYSSRCNPNLHGLSPNFLCLSSRLSVCHALWSNSTKVLPSAKWKMWVCVGERFYSWTKNWSLWIFLFFLVWTSANHADCFWKAIPWAPLQSCIRYGNHPFSFLAVVFFFFFFFCWILFVHVFFHQSSLKASNTKQPSKSRGLWSFFPSSSHTFVIIVSVGNGQ